MSHIPSSNGHRRRLKVLKFQLNAPNCSNVLPNEETELPTEMPPIKLELAHYCNLLVEINIRQKRFLESRHFQNSINHFKYIYLHARVGLFLIVTSDWVITNHSLNSEKKHQTSRFFHFDVSITDSRPIKLFTPSYIFSEQLKVGDSLFLNFCFYVSRLLCAQNIAHSLRHKATRLGLQGSPCASAIKHLKVLNGLVSSREVTYMHFKIYRRM